MEIELAKKAKEFSKALQEEPEQTENFKSSRIHFKHNDNKIKTIKEKERN